MKLYIWDSNGIGYGQGDNGVLVVLAESEEQAREIARESAAANQARRDDYAKRLHDACIAAGAIPSPEGGWMPGPQAWSSDPEVTRVLSEWRADDARSEHLYFDGRTDAVDRAPDRIVDLAVPTVVVFHEGGITE